MIDKSPSPDDVTGATLRWRERSARRRYDGDTEELPTVDVNGGSFDLQTEVGMGSSESGQRTCSVRVRAYYGPADTYVVIDVEVIFQISESAERVDDAFVQRHALPFAFGYARGAFTDACRSVGLQGFMIPMVDLASSTLIEK